MMTQFTPGGLEGLTRERSALLASGAPDPEKFAEITARYDTEFLETPQFQQPIPHESV